MTAIFDTSTVLAIFNPSERFHRWSLRQLEERKAAGVAIITDVIYAEASVTIRTRDEMDAVVKRYAFERMPSNDEALFVAGKAYRKYRRRDGQKLNVLPDFFIGASAIVAGVPLVTANPKDYIGYFGDVEVICPPELLKG